MTDQQLLSSFRREKNGEWTCIKPTLFDGSARNLAILPGVVIRKSDYYFGMDIARELDEAAARRDGSVKLQKPIHH